jgi:hypothetical protein
LRTPVPGLVLEKLHAGRLERLGRGPVLGALGAVEHATDPLVRGCEPDHGVVDAGRLGEGEHREVDARARLEHLLHQFHLRTVHRREQGFHSDVREAELTRFGLVAFVQLTERPAAVAQELLQVLLRDAFAVQHDDVVEVVARHRAGARRILARVGEREVGRAGQHGGRRQARVPHHELLVEDLRVEIGDDIDTGAQHGRVDRRLSSLSPTSAQGSATGGSSAR